MLSKEALAKHEKFLEEMAKKDGVPESPKSRRSCCGKCSKLPGKPVTWTRNTKKRRVELAVLQKNSLLLTVGPWMGPNATKITEVQC